MELPYKNGSGKSNEIIKSELGIKLLAFINKPVGWIVLGLGVIFFLKLLTADTMIFNVFL